MKFRLQKLTLNCYKLKEIGKSSETELLLYQDIRKSSLKLFHITL